MKRLPDATSSLLGAVTQRLHAHGATGVTFQSIRSRPWASVTFSGARHQLLVFVPGQSADAAVDGFVAGLDVADIPMRGHILADVAAVSREAVAGGVRLGLEALTVEDG